MTAVHTGIRAGEAIAAQQGWREVLGAYSEHCDRVYTEYLAAWRRCYADEARWRDRPFWRAPQFESAAALSVRA